VKSPFLAGKNYFATFSLDKNVYFVLWSLGMPGSGRKRLRSLARVRVCCAVSFGADLGREEAGAFTAVISGSAAVDCSFRGAHDRSQKERTRWEWPGELIVWSHSPLGENRQRASIWHNREKCGAGEGGQDRPNFALADGFLNRIDGVQHRIESQETKMHRKGLENDEALQSLKTVKFFYADFEHRLLNGSLLLIPAQRASSCSGCNVLPLKVLALRFQNSAEARYSCVYRFCQRMTLG
jgi:hypothetical protein